MLAPRNLSVSVQDATVTLNWDEPGIETGWFTHAQTEEFENSIGTGDYISFTVVQKFTPAQLNDLGVAGAQLTKVSFMSNFADATYIVKVWTGGSGSPLNPGNSILAQSVGTAIEQQWKEVVLVSPVNIPLDEELWIGYTLTTSGGFPAGCDNGHVMEGYGNVMHFSGEWTTLTQLAANLTYNWMIIGFADTPESSVAFTAKNVELNPVISESVNSKIISENTKLSLAYDRRLLENRISANSRTRAFIGYNVYRDNTLLTETPINTLEYVDTDVASGVYTYSVTAVYDSGESVPVSLIAVVGDFIVNVFPWSEGFEGEIFPPFGWSQLDNNNDGHTWFKIIGQDVANTGNASAASASWYNGVVLYPDNWLITPKIQLPSASVNQSMYLKYFVAAQDPEWPQEHYAVMISTTGTAPANFTQVYSETLQNADWMERTINLSAYEGQDIYIAFRHFNVSDMFYIKLDDIWIGSGVSETDEVAQIVKTELRGNYPNPFNPETVISFSVANGGQVELDIYNVKGQKVKSLVDDNLNAGNHQIVWNGLDENGRKVGSGIYFFRLKSDNYISTRKMILMK